MKIKFLSVIAIILSLSLAASKVMAETAITSLPYTINTSGSYYISSDLTTNQAGIYIFANDVTIDLRGHSLIGAWVDGQGTYGYGIYIPNTSNIEIRNGTVRNFGLGIWGQNLVSENIRIINLRVIDNYTGMDLDSDKNYIESVIVASNEQYGIITTGDSSTTSTIIQNSMIHNNGISGIKVGNGSTLVNNTVRDNGRHGIEAGFGSAIRSNTVSNNAGSGITCTSGCNIINNTVYKNQHGIFCRSCSFINNTAYENYLGIEGRGNSLFKNNTVHSNESSGILFQDNSLIDGNLVYNNGYNMLLTCATCTYGLNHAPTP